MSQQWRSPSQRLPHIVPSLAILRFEQGRVLLHLLLPVTPQVALSTRIPRPLGCGFQIAGSVSSLDLLSLSPFCHTLSACFPSSGGRSLADTHTPLLSSSVLVSVAKEQLKHSITQIFRPVA